MTTEGELELGVADLELERDERSRMLDDLVGRLARGADGVGRLRLAVLGDDPEVRLLRLAVNAAQAQVPLLPMQLHGCLQARVDSLKPSFIGESSF